MDRLFIKSAELVLQWYFLGKNTYHLLRIFERKGWVFLVLSWLKMDICRKTSCLLDLVIFLFITCSFSNGGFYVYCKETCICQLSKWNFAIFKWPHLLKILHYSHKKILFAHMFSFMFFHCSKGNLLFYVILNSFKFHSTR